MKYSENQKMPMRDGILLNYDLYQPDIAGLYPGILMRTPYTKVSLTREGIYSNFRRFVDHGYNVIVVECRGTGESEGILNANAVSEYDDGYDTVEWIGAQAWCDGSVGMMGLSYFGFTQIAAAVTAPKALKAICPFMTMAVEPFGSQITQTYNYGHIGWIYGQLTSNMEKFVPDDVQRAKVEGILREYQTKLNAYALHLPANQNPAALVEGVPLLQDYLDLINGMENKSFWDAIRHPADFSKAHTAMLHCTGWFDVCLDTTIRNWTATLQDGDDYTKDAAKLIIGPWAHGGGFNSSFGTFDFGQENDGAGQGINGKMLAWYDYHIKGKQNSVKDWAKVRYFVLGLNKWLESSCWPPAEAEIMPYYLHDGGMLSTTVPLANEPPDTFTYDPMDPAPAYVPGKSGQFEVIPDYSVVINRADILTYETPVLDQAATVAGIVRMRLHAVTDAKDTDFACRLVDVYPDGSEFLVAQGLIRAKWRKGFFKHDPITPGEATEYLFDVGNVGCCFLKGHRIKIHVSSALSPLYDRNLNTGEPSAFCDHYEIAHQTILHDAVHPSCVLLPLLPKGMA